MGDFDEIHEATKNHPSDPFTLTIQIGGSQAGAELLSVRSDGRGSFTIEGSRLRAPEYGVGLGAPGYTTGDDSHVLGLVTQQLGALLAVEIIRRALAARKVLSNG